MHIARALHHAQLEFAGPRCAQHWGWLWGALNRVFFRFISMRTCSGKQSLESDNCCNSSLYSPAPASAPCRLNKADWASACQPSNRSSVSCWAPSSMATASWGSWSSRWWATRQPLTLTAPTCSSMACRGQGARHLCRRAPHSMNSQCRASRDSGRHPLAARHRQLPQTQCLIQCATDASSTSACSRSSWVPGSCHCTLVACAAGQLGRHGSKWCS